MALYFYLLLSGRRTTPHVMTKKTAQNPDILYPDGFFDVKQYVFLSKSHVFTKDDISYIRDLIHRRFEFSVNDQHGINTLDIKFISDIAGYNATDAIKAIEDNSRILTYSIYYGDDAAILDQIIDKCLAADLNNKIIVSLFEIQNVDTDVINERSEKIEALHKHNNVSFYARDRNRFMRLPYTPLRL